MAQRLQKRGQARHPGVGAREVVRIQGPVRGGGTGSVSNCGVPLSLQPLEMAIYIRRASFHSFHFTAVS